MPKRLLLLTGRPGIGKTTVLLRTVETLGKRGHKAGGMVSREIRSGEARVGFEIVDIISGRTGWLAHISQEAGPQVGKYRVNLEDLNNVGVQAIATAVENRNVVVIDEIGPMELFSEEFVEAAEKAVESSRLVISVVHWKANSRLIDRIRTREDAQTYVVTVENRDGLHTVLADKSVEFLSKSIGRQTVITSKANSSEKSGT